MTLYYVLIALISIICGVSLFFLIKKFDNKKHIILRIVAVITFLIMMYRYLSMVPSIATVRGLNMYSPFGYDVTSTIIGLILPWFTYAVIVLIALHPFFKIKNIGNVLKLFGVPVLIIDIIFFKTYCMSINVDCFKESTNIIPILCAIEIGLSLAYIGAVFIRKDYFKISKKEIINFFITIVPILFAIMPAYTLQGLVGFKFTENIGTKELTPGHRTLLYGSVVIPILLYFAFKDRDEETKRFSMIYLSIATLWTFMIKFGFAKLLESPISWPLHLCNTAMYIIPLCLIFKMKRLFYFTFFINVMGAFIAMAMPNTNDAANILSTNIYVFWVNHFCAFFMPILLVALGIFERPKLKQWIYSMSAFFVYFVFILIINAWFSNYGSVDFFFLNSDFIVAKLGDWARNTRNLTWNFEVKGLTLTFYPVYQGLFFIVYIFVSVAMWFLYEQLFELWDSSTDRRNREKAYKKMRKELKDIIKSQKGGEIMDKHEKPCLELKDFSKRYGRNKHYSVKNASLKVEGGCIFGFLGHNGAGKSTIIKSIVGIQKITSGNIEVCGYDVDKQPVEAKKQIGFVPDHYALYENLTGREYINYIADLYGVSKEDRDIRINKYLKNFELIDAFDNQMKTYSHGMKQKIAIMAALVHNPKVWILDEPLTGLDPNSIFQVKESMKEHAKEGNIVFFSSHIIDVVERICDKIAIIKKGNIVCVEDVKTLEKKKISLEDFYLQANNGKIE